jgi:signal transduction histidine kinase
MIERKYELIRLLSSSSFLVTSVDDFVKISNDSKRGEIILLLNRIKRYSPEQTEIHVVNTEGFVIASTDSNYFNQNYSKRKSFEKPRQQGKPFINDFFYKENMPVVTMSSPIYQGEVMIGVLIMERNASDFISLTSDYTGLGKTGETYLGVKLNDKIYFLNPLRYDKNAALNKMVPVKDSSYALNIVMAKKEGLFTDVLDYRGKEVIASTRYIEETGWGMVTEMDRSEVFESIVALRNKMIIITIVAILITFVVAYFLSKFISRPIDQLTAYVDEISRGNLKNRTLIKSDNEIGNLAKSFNVMASQLEDNIKELNKSNDSLIKFAYVISHDLKTPLNSILGIFEILKQETYPKLDDESRKWMDIQYSKAKEMEELIQGVLLSAQKKSGPNIKENVDLNKIVKKVVESLNVPSNFFIHVHRPLPIVRHHKIPMIQVFQNLIGNAIKYCDKPEGKIKIDFIEEEHLYRVCINDNGPGIKNEDYQKIFKMFESADVEKKSNIESSGIGLSVVKKIIEDNGGRIWLESKLNVGTTFYFTILK